MYILTDEGKKYLKHGLPEKNLLDMVEKHPVALTEARKKIENFSIGLQWAKSKGWIEIREGRIYAKQKPNSIPEKEALESVWHQKDVDDEILSVLMKRNLVMEERDDITKRASKLVGHEITNLTEDLIKTGMWKKVRFRPYNVEFSGKKICPGKMHIISCYIEKIRKIFLDLGFSEAEGPLIESSFWNFDALYQPQDHPSRDLADTFYMKNVHAKLPDKRLVDAVKKTHENGANTGSTGWRYSWNHEIAKHAIMRTHTTAVSARSLYGLQPPAKVFCIGRVFRNETIDYKHLAEFTQVEGIVVDENVGFRDLLGYLKEFYSRLGFEKIRFRPGYFPYTEMSTEIEVYFSDRREWLEMGGSGIFRPEVTKPFGIDCPVLAWGLGLERLVMLKHNINDIRNFYYKNDLEMIRNIHGVY